MRYLITLLFILPLFAEPHPHVTSISYLPFFHSIEWTTQNFNDKEEPLSTKSESWNIYLPSSTMSHDLDRREFEESESIYVIKELDSFIQFIAEKIVGGDASKIVELKYDLNWHSISISVQEFTLVTYTYFEGSLFEDDKHLVTLDSVTNDLLLDTSRTFIRYCVASTIWWNENPSPLKKA